MRACARSFTTDGEEANDAESAPNTTTPANVSGPPAGRDRMTMRATERIGYQVWDEVPKANGPFKELVLASFEDDVEKMRSTLVEHPKLLNRVARCLSPWSLRELFSSLGDTPKLQEKLFFTSIQADAFKQGQLLEFRTTLPLARQAEFLAHASGEVRDRLERVAFGTVALPDAPPTLGADWVRLEAGKESISPLVRGFVDANQFGPRIAAVRAGEPGLVLEEQAELRNLLGTLDGGQRKALRDAMIAKHPQLKEIASHPAVKGPPTVEALIALLAGRPFGKIPPMSVALQADFDDVLADLPKDLSREQATDYLLGSKDLILYAATYPASWRGAAEALSPGELDKLQVGTYRRGRELRALDWRLSDQYDSAFKGIRQAIDQIGGERFASFFETYMSFEPSRHGMVQLLGFQYEQAQKALDFPKFVTLIELIGVDQRTSFLHQVAVNHGFDAIIDKAKTLGEKAFATWLQSPPSIDAAATPPPDRVPLAGGSLGTPVPLERVLIQRARKWPAEQSERYGAEMGAVITELQGKLGSELTSFEAALAFVGSKVTQVAERVLPKEFNRGLLDPPSENRASWGRPRTTLRYSLFPHVNEERTDRLLGRKGVWVNGQGGAVLTIASKLSQRPVLFHTAPAEIPSLCKELEPVFARALTAKDPEAVVAAVAELHWWAANIMPFERGSAGAIDALAKALLERHGIESGAWKSDISPDVEAMLMPLADFVQAYPSFFETTPTQG